jgi:uncharacterized protein
MQIVVADLSAVALDPAPIEPSWIIEGAPEARAKELARSADGTAVVVDWSCTAGQFHWHYSVDETLHAISGEVFITNHGGAERRLGPGDMAFLPAGSCSLWRVPCAVRKLAVCRQSLPKPFGLAPRFRMVRNSHKPEESVLPGFTPPSCRSTPAPRRANASSTCSACSPRPTCGANGSLRASRKAKAAGVYKGGRVDRRDHGAPVESKGHGGFGGRQGLIGRASGAGRAGGWAKRVGAQKDALNRVSACCSLTQIALNSF